MINFRLVALHGSLKKLLPEDYVVKKLGRSPDVQVEPLRSKKSWKRSMMEFNGVKVSYPQYLHLMSLQRKVLKLDATLKKIEMTTDPETLEGNPTWEKLINLRTSLAKLLPEE